MTPIQAIKAKCLDCNCGQEKEIKLCTETNCPLHAFRLGKNPNKQTRNYTPEQREAAAERMRKARAAKTPKNAI